MAAICEVLAVSCPGPVLILPRTNNGASQSQKTICKRLLDPPFVDEMVDHPNAQLQVSRRTCGHGYLGQRLTDTAAARRPKQAA